MDYVLKCIVEGGGEMDCMCECLFTGGGSAADCMSVCWGGRSDCVHAELVLLQYADGAIACTRISTPCVP